LGMLTYGLPVVYDTYIYIYIYIYIYVVYFYLSKLFHMHGRKATSIKDKCWKHL